MKSFYSHFLAYLLVASALWGCQNKQTKKPPKNPPTAISSQKSSTPQKPSTSQKTHPKARWPIKTETKEAKKAVDGHYHVSFTKNGKRHLSLGVLELKSSRYEFFPNSVKAPASIVSRLSFLKHRHGRYRLSKGPKISFTPAPRQGSSFLLRRDKDRYYFHSTHDELETFSIHKPINPRQVSIKLVSVSVQKSKNMFTVWCKAILKNSSQKNLPITTNFLSVFDGFSLLVLDKRGKVVASQAYIYHQSPFANKRELLLPPGDTSKELVFPFQTKKGWRDSFTVRLVGELPGPKSVGGLLSNEKSLSLK